jgi:hypothetical protein
VKRYRDWAGILNGVPATVLLAAFLLAAHGSLLAAQDWNSPETLDLVRRAILARQRAEPDSSLTSYRTRAHGFLFFLAQVGQGLQGPPRLIKADELEVEVYWRAPAASKQVILAWRDGRWLPTDINYHRDHLGIVTNNFGDRIRIGEGDEVRDVAHPLAATGPDLYEYRLLDSVRLRRRDTVLQLHEVAVRPRDAAAPAVIGTLSLDAATGDLVRFRFSFTPAAYLDSSLEDISIVLENARLEDRWWLPWRQEVEIRRRVSWLDFPARSIIRGRWEIGDYDLNVSVPERILAGPAIDGLRVPVDTGGPWTVPLASAVKDAGRPVEQGDLEAVRREIESIAGETVLSGLPATRLGLSAVSDLARVNRVQGLALGLGFSVRAAPPLILRPRFSLGTSDERVYGDLLARWDRAGTSVTVAVGRHLRDLVDLPIISGVVNSVLSQEGGDDRGDYVLLDAATTTASRNLGSGFTASFGAGVERSRSVRSAAQPASGRYRANPALGAGTIGIGRVGIEYVGAALDRGKARRWSLALEGGSGDREYLRAVAAVSGIVRAGPGNVSARLEGGAGSRDLPGYRSFAIGGWGTLVGEPFRRWGGRRVLHASLEYRLDAPFPALPLGAFASTGRSITLAPFVAAGWTGGRLAGLPWQPSRHPRTVAGLALEWFHHLLRVEAGVSLHTGAVGVTVDFSREWWEVL